MKSIDIINPSEGLTIFVDELIEELDVEILRKGYWDKITGEYKSSLSNEDNKNNYEHLIKIGYNEKNHYSFCEFNFFKFLISQFQEKQKNMEFINVQS